MSILYMSMIIYGNFNLIMQVKEKLRNSFDAAVAVL